MAFGDRPKTKRWKKVIKGAALLGIGAVGGAALMRSKKVASGIARLRSNKKVADALKSGKETYGKIKEVAEPVLKQVKDKGIEIQGNLNKFGGDVKSRLKNFSSRYKKKKKPGYKDIQSAMESNIL